LLFKGVVFYPFIIKILKLKTVEIRIIHETTLENSEAIEEVEIWMDLYLASYEDTHDTPGGSDIEIKDWGVIEEDERGHISYTDVKPNWVTFNALYQEAEIAFGRYKDMADENPFAE
jgi:hypothetical protein